MKYTYKERVRIAKKLKIFLAIFFAAITFFTGKVLLDKTFAVDPSPYGTATITFNSGSDGQFAGGTTTNIVTYNLEKITEKYSHTDNVSDDGAQNGNYENNINKNDVVTITGADSLHVRITYGGESSTYDWSCIWEGAHSDYTASANYSTSISGKLGGGSHTSSSNTKEYDITGDSVTFGFVSDGSGCGDGYGYYAVVTAVGDNVTELKLGEINSGEYKEPIGNGDLVFGSWNPSLSTLDSSTTVTATYLDLIASGTYDGVDWKIKGDGALILGKDGQTQSFSNNAARYYYNYPWNNYRDRITSVMALGQINGNGSLANMFYDGNSTKSYPKLVEIDLSNLNTTNVTNMQRMFSGCQSLVSLDISNFNTTNVTNMYYMFGYCKELLELEVGQFNTSNVTDMSYMFWDCHSITSLNVSNFNTASVTSFDHIFAGCEKLTTLDVSSFNTSNVTNMDYTFAWCKKLTQLNLTNFNTSNVTTMDCMFLYCESLTNLNVSSFNTSNVTNMDHMFCKCSGLTTLDVSSFNTSNVTNMSYMFAEVNSLKKLSLSNFNTSNVTDMSCMFEGPLTMERLDLSSFNTSNVTTMSCMFQAGTGNIYNKFKYINVSSFDTSNVTELGGMFYGCANLIYVDISDFNTTNTTNMADMFHNCKKLTSLDLSNFDTTNVTSMNHTFSNTTDLRILKLGTNFKFNNNINGPNLQNSWKRDGDSITYDYYELMQNYNGSTMAGTYRRVDITPTAILYSNGELVFQFGNEADPTKGTVLGTYTGFETTTYSNASSVPWYSKRTSVTKITLNNSVVPISTAYWFYGMTNLNKINNISNLNTSLTTTTKSMFENCTKLTSFNLNSINANNLVNMNSMFRGCTSLQSLNMSSFKAENLTDVTNIFTNTNLKILTLGNQIEFNVLPTLSGTWKRDGNNTTYTGNQIFGEAAGIYRETTNSIYVIIYDNGEMVFQQGNTPDPSKGNVIDTYNGFDMTEYTVTSSIPWYSNRTNVTKAIFNTVVNPISTENWFFGMTNLTEIENIEYLNTENVTSMASMFQNCSNITTLDLSSFDTSLVEDMGWIFYGCSTLTTLDISSFDTSNVTDMDRMFSGCGSLISIDVTNFNTSQVTDMYGMFDGCESITEIDVTNFDTSNVTNMAHMFISCVHLEELDLSSFDTSKVTSMSTMFCYCTHLVTIDMSNFDTSKVTDMYMMFRNCAELISADTSSFDTSKVTNMGWMFCGCYKLPTINVSNFDTSKVTSMDSMFFACNNVQELDFSNWNTQNVTEMTDMFSGTTKLNVLKLGENFKFLSNNDLERSWVRDGDTTIYTAAELTSLYNGSTMAGTYRIATEMYAEFDSSNGKLRIFRDEVGSYSNNQIWGTKTYFTGLEDLTGYVHPKWYSYRSSITNVVIEDVFRPKTAAYLFSDSSSLISIVGIENLDTGNTTIMSGMFSNCGSLTTLDLNSLNTENVVDMKFMFSNCSNLTTLDLSGFNTENVTDMNHTFYYCNSLTVLDLSSFNTGNVKDMSAMFNGCNSIVTLDLSSFDTSNVTDMSAMLAFGGTNRQPPYDAELTTLNISSFNTSNVTNMDRMFYGCNKLNSLNVASFNTSNVLNMSKMFAYCKKITGLNLDNFNTSNVTTMEDMFYSCSKLTSLDLSNFNTGNVTTMRSMFELCHDLFVLDISSFNTINVTSLVNMFYGCESLTSLDLRHFNTINNTSTYAMFAGCKNLSNLDISSFNTSNVTGMGGMFENCSKLTSLDLRHFNTNNVTRMDTMFKGCSVLKTLDISSFDTSSVTNMQSMFSSTTKLNTLKLGTNWSFLSNNGLTKSWIRDGDTIVYTAAELTNSYNGSTMSGTYRAMTKLTISEQVKGTLADINKNINFTITMMDGIYELEGTYSYAGSKTGYFDFEDGEATFTLKHGETIYVYLPYYYTYSIVQNPDGYTLAKTNDTGTLNKDKTASFIDTLNGTTPTGIFLDLIPYILMIIFGVGSIFIIKRNNI